MPERGTDDVEPFVPDIELEIGLVMRSAAISSEDGDDGVLHLPASELDGRRGTRAPHVWLDEGRSTLDLFGSGFVVLRPAGAGVDDWAPPGAVSAVVAATDRSVRSPLSVGTCPDRTAGRDASSSCSSTFAPGTRRRTSAT